MKIAQVNTYDTAGGAARASYRLHSGMRQIGQDSTLIVRYKDSSDDTVQLVANERLNKEFDTSPFTFIQNYKIPPNRTNISNTFFSLSYPGFDLSHLDTVLQADIINLHWIANFQSPLTIRKLLQLGKPVVWTIHDMAAITGGCHYGAGCDRYQDSCSQCPQLKPGLHYLTSAVLFDKIELFAEFSNLTFVTASQWLANCVRKSSAFQHCRIETVPYSLELDQFSPSDKTKAKRHLGIHPDTFVIAAASVKEIRKGFVGLLRSLGYCLKDKHISQLIDQGQIKLLCYGSPCELLNQQSFPYIHIGWLNSDKELIELYQAADLVVLPAQEDNMPLTMLEGMSCGTPIAAFDVGGLSDIITDKVTGRLVPDGDWEQLAQIIIECVLNPQDCKRMGDRSRIYMEQGFVMPRESEKYLDLYQDLITSNNTNTVLASRKLVRRADSQDSPEIHGSKGQKRISSDQSRQLAQLDSIAGRHVYSVSSEMLAEVHAKEDAHQQQVNDTGVTEVALLGEQLREARNRIQLLNGRLKLRREEKENNNKTITSLTNQLEDLRVELQSLRSSKFWKLRYRWFQLKRILGLQD